MGHCDWIEILCLYLRRRQFKVCPTKWYRMFRYICCRCRHMIRNKIGRPGGSHSRDAHYHWATFALLQVILAPPHYYLAATFSIHHNLFPRLICTLIRKSKAPCKIYPIFFRVAKAPEIFWDGNLRKSWFSY